MSSGSEGLRAAPEEIPQEGQEIRRDSLVLENPAPGLLALLRGWSPDLLALLRSV